MTAPVARADHAAEINGIEHLQSRVDACSRLTGRTPNQILVISLIWEMWSNLWLT